MATGDDAPTKRELPAGATPRAREAEAAPVDDPRFEPVREIGRGGMGRVVEARDKRLDRIVALKESLDATTDTRVRFEREVAITARLEHPSIVPLYDAGTAPDGTPYYVMRKVSGERLDHLIRDAKTLDQRLRLLPNMLAVADAVAHAHTRGVIHRDLKPSNVLVGEHGETILIDWGLAKTVDEGDASAPHARPRTGNIELTTIGSVVGTPGFLAPEQCRGEAAGLRSDVYALGATLYFLLAGRMAVTPEAGERVMMERAEAGAIDPLEQHAPGLAPDLVTIVTKAMAREPMQRYADAAGFAEDLRRFLGGQLVASHHYPPLQRLARFIRRNRAVVAASMIGLAVAVAIAVVALRRIFAEQRRTEAALLQERDRADDLLVTQAYGLLERDPTRAIATLQQLRADSPRWSSLGPLLAEARMRGIAVGYPSDGFGVARFSRSDQRIVTNGQKKIRIHDLRARTSTVLVEGDARMSAWWCGPLVLVQSRELDAPPPRLIEPKTRAHHDIQWSSPILDLTSSDGVIAFVDADRRVATLDATGLPITATPTVLPVAMPAVEVDLSPSGKWLVVTGKDRVQVFRRDGTWQLVGELPVEHVILAFDTAEQRIAIASHRGGPHSVVELELATMRELRRWDVGLVLTMAYVDRNPAVQAPGQIVELADGGKVKPVWSGDQVSSFGIVGGDGLLVAVEASRRVRIKFEGFERTLTAPVDIQVVSLDPGREFLVGVGSDAILAWNLTQIVPRAAAVEIADHLQFVDGTTLAAIGVTYQQTLVRYRLASPFSIAKTDQLATGEPSAVFNVLENGTVASFDTHHGSTIVYTDHLAKRQDLTAVAAHGSALVIGTKSGSVELHDPVRGTTARLFELGSSIASVSRHSDWIAAIAASGWAARRHISGHVQRWRLPGTGGITIASDGTAYTHDGTWLVAWPVLGGPFTAATFEKNVRGALLAYADQLVVMTVDGAVHLYDPRARSGRLVFNATQSALSMGIAVSNDGRMVAAREASFISVFDVVHGQSWPIADRLMAHTLALSPDGTQLVAGVRRAGNQTLLYHFDVSIPNATPAWVRAATNAKPPSSSRAPLEWHW